MKYPTVKNPTRTAPLLAAALAALPAVAAAETLTLRQGLDGYAGTADTTLDSEQPETSVSRSEGIFLGGTDGRTRQGLLRFDLAGVPAGAAVEKATLTLRRGPNGGFAPRLVLHDLTEPVDIDAATYASTGEGVRVGGQTDEKAYSSAAGLGSNGLQTIDVTELVAEDVADPEGNRGYLLLGGEGTAFLEVASSEADDEELRPTLEIEYDPAGGGREPADDEDVDEDEADEAAEARPALEPVTVAFPADGSPVELARETFEGAFVPVAAGETADLDGTYPAGSPVALDSGWATIDASFGPVPADGGEGETALAVEVDSVTDGAAMLLIRGPLPMGDDVELRLSMLVLGGGQGFDVNLREVYDEDRGYNVLSRRTVTTANEWQRAEIAFPPAANPHGGEIELRFTRPGQYRIDDVRLVAVRRDREAMRAELAGRNLLYASSQPAGRTAAWNFGTGTATDPDAPLGPTGVAPIRVAAPDGGHESLYLSVPTEVGGTFTFSFHARTADGSGAEPGKLGARLYPNLADPWWVGPYVTNVEVSGDWRRYSHTVELPPAGEGFHVAELVLAAGGPDVLIDGLMVEAGDEAGPFVRAAPVELGITADKPLGVHYEDEPVALELNGWGDVGAAAAVSVTTYDASGDVHRQEVELPEPQDGVASAAVTLGGDLPLGPVRVEAVAVDSGGGEVSPTEEIVLHRVRRPRRAGEFLPDSPFGVHLWPGRPDAADAAARLGFRWVRAFEGVDWPSVEPREGEYRWETMDRQLADLEPHGFGVMGILGTTPEWARADVPGAEAFGGYWVKKVKPADPAVYGRYVAAVAERYAGRVHAYEPWNEPFWARFFVGDVAGGERVRGTPADYAALHTAAADAVREHAPGTLMVWNTGGAYEREDARANDRAIAALGLLDPKYTDVITVHDYGGSSAPAGFPGDLASTKHPEAAQALLREFGRPEVPVWDSESGLPPGQPTGNLYRHAVPAGREATTLDQADNLVRVYVSRLAAGLDKWFLYTFSARTAYRPTYDLLAPDGHVPAFGSGAQQPVLAHRGQAVRPGRRPARRLPRLRLRRRRRRAGRGDPRPRRAVDARRRPRRRAGLVRQRRGRRAGRRGAAGLPDAAGRGRRRGGAAGAAGGQSVAAR